LLGGVFALGWTPCIGPALGAVLTLAYNEATATRGAVLTFVFTLGLGLPFIAAALAYDSLARVVAVVRRHQQLIMRTGGVLMIMVGIAMVTGLWALVNDWMRQWAAGFLPVI
jgi:cytochrome c-type biogenesis protein